MRRETIFNREAAYVFGVNAAHETIMILRKYMARSRGASYFEALEYLGSAIGIEYHVIEKRNPRTGKVTGYWPAVKYQEGNLENRRAGTMKFMHAPFKTQSACYDYLGRKYVHTLMDANLPGLAARVLGE